MPTYLLMVCDAVLGDGGVFDAYVALPAPLQRAEAGCSVRRTIGPFC